MKTYYLGELITQRREKNPGGDLPILGVSKDGWIPPKQKDADTSIYNVFYRNDFVFNPARMELNSIAFNNLYDKAICSSLYEVFCVNRTDLIMPEYLNLIIKQNWFTRYCEFLGSGSAREYCRVANISEIPVEVPELSVQSKAVKYNDVITRRIELKKKINDNLRDSGLSIIEKTVGTAALINKTQNELDSVAIPNGWTIRTVSDFCKETKSGATPSRSEPDYWNNGTIPWLKSGEVHNGITLKTEEYITQSGLNNSSTKILPSDTVLMAMYGVTAGEVGYLSIPATTNQAICGMICNTPNEAAYLFFALLQNQSAASRLSNGGAQDNLSKAFIDNIHIVCPPNEIINKLGLSSLIKAMTLSTKEMDCLEQLRSTILSLLSSR